MIYPWSMIWLSGPPWNNTDTTSQYLNIISRQYIYCKILLISDVGCACAMRLHLNIFLHALLARQTEMVLEMAPQIHMHMIHTRTHWHIWHTWDTHSHTQTHVALESSQPALWLLAPFFSFSCFFLLSAQSHLEHFSIQFDRRGLKTLPLENKSFRLEGGNSWRRLQPRW